MDFHLPSLITVFTLLLLFGVALNVGRARGKYKIDAPATTGHPKFELAYRVQMNTVKMPWCSCLCCGCFPGMSAPPGPVLSAGYGCWDGFGMR
jgi:hypothetical protein